jgi:hypothetical protein
VSLQRFEISWNILTDEGPGTPENFSVEEINFPMEEMCFVGLVTLIDPPKEEVNSTIYNDLQ